MPLDGPAPQDVDLVRDRVRVHNFKELGKVLIRMIANRERPTDGNGNRIEGGDIAILKEYLRHQTGGVDVVTFPDRIETFRIEQSTWTEFVMRLPPWQLGAAGRNRVCDPNGGEIPGVDYEEPEFYAQKVNREPPEINSCDFFFSRVADYTMGMCK